MTSCRWVLVKADGRVASGDWATSPRQVLGDPGEVLVIERPGGAVAFAPQARGAIHWLATVDRDMATGGLVRRTIGPAIVSPDPVRVWLPAEGLPVVADGPVEAAYRALEVLQSAREAC